MKKYLVIGLVFVFLMCFAGKIFAFEASLLGGFTYMGVSGGLTVEQSISSTTKIRAGGSICGPTSLIVYILGTKSLIGKIGDVYPVHFLLNAYYKEATKLGSPGQKQASFELGTEIRNSGLTPYFMLGYNFNL
jgi:hypothetical protein